MQVSGFPVNLSRGTGPRKLAAPTAHACKHDSSSRIFRGER